MQPAPLQQPSKIRTLSVCGLVLLTLSLIFTVSLARFFFVGTPYTNSTYSYPSPLTFFSQGVTTQAIITSYSTCLNFNGIKGLYSIGIQYQDIDHVTQSSGIACAVKSMAITTVAIRFVPGNPYGVELQSAYQNMNEYYLHLVIIIPAQILITIALIIVAAKAHPKSLIPVRQAVREAV